MAWISAVFTHLPAQWTILALIAGIGLAVIFLRGILHLVVRALFIGAVGVILLGAALYIANIFHIAL
jgi:hypothetical protein